MRALFWILLLGNVVLFAAMQGWPLAADEQVVQAQPPLHQEKISLLNAPQDRAAAASSASASTPASMPEETPAPLAAGSAALCMEWGDFSGEELRRATTALAALQLGDKLSERQAEHAIGYWVYIPPLKDKAAVNRKVAQLKARGIEEYFIVSEAGPWLNAISLGVFKTREAAQHFLDELQRTKDIRTAQIGERASKLRTTVFLLNGLDAKTAATLVEMQKDFAGSEFKEVSCALTR